MAANGTTSAAAVCKRLMVKWEKREQARSAESSGLWQDGGRPWDSPWMTKCFLGYRCLLQCVNL